MPKDEEIFENSGMEDIEGDEEVVIVMTDENGDEHYFIEEMIIPVDGETFALLLPDGEDEEDTWDDEAFFAKIITDEDGDEQYVEVTDEEYDKVLEIYNEIMGEE